MEDKYNSLAEVTRSEVRKIKSPLFDEVMKTINAEIEFLCEEGFICFGSDYSLSGFPLECRVKEIFKKMGFEIVPGRDGMEDFVIRAPGGVTPATPLVLEVKSSGKPHLTRKELRQLDDWVFELSGEQKARKYGLGGGGGTDYLAFASMGLVSRHSKPVFHPTPHKGVLIFNGPIGRPFTERTTDCIGPNDEEFVDKRNFCIIAFDVLINYFEECSLDPEIKNRFWSQIHSTTGLLRYEKATPGGDP
jgi:hypothetical protein